MSRLDDALGYAARAPGLPLRGLAARSRLSRAASTPPPPTRRRSGAFGGKPIATSAFPTGLISGFWVLDIDGAEGEANLRALEARHGALPATREVISGGGGRHLLFAYTGPIPSTRRPDRPRHRCARRRRLCRRAAEHPPEWPRLCLVGRRGRPLGRRAGIG